MKKIFIAATDMAIGGAERALLGLLNALDKEKYQIDLFLLHHSGPLMLSLIHIFGSELCRQIAGYHPKQLIIFDIYENNAYELQMAVSYTHLFKEGDILFVSGSKEGIFKLNQWLND